MGITSHERCRHHHWATDNRALNVTFSASCDLMERNLDRRVEALCPIFNPEIRRYLRDELLHAYLHDDTRATVLRPSAELPTSLKSEAV
jgi:polyphosphate kinase